MRRGAHLDDPNGVAANAAFDELRERWGRKYGAIITL
jgi:hypothetical protein